LEVLLSQGLVKINSARPGVAGTARDPCREMFFTFFMYEPKGGGVSPVSRMFVFGCPGHAFVKVTQQ